MYTDQIEKKNNVFEYLSRSYSSSGGGNFQVTSASSAILDKLWTKVQTEPLSKEELIDVSTMIRNICD